MSAAISCSYHSNLIILQIASMWFIFKWDRDCSPFALPAVFGHILQRGIQAVGVIADVTVVTQE